MKKDEMFDLVVKGFGVYLLVPAIIAIPKMLEGIMMLGFNQRREKIKATLSNSAASRRCAKVFWRGTPKGIWGVVIRGKEKNKKIEKLLHSVQMHL